MSIPLNPGQILTCQVKSGWGFNQFQIIHNFGKGTAESYCYLLRDQNRGSKPRYIMSDKTLVVHVQLPCPLCHG